jgi:hypothetical protein
MHWNEVVDDVTSLMWGSWYHKNINYPTYLPFYPPTPTHPPTLVHSPLHAHLGSLCCVSLPLGCCSTPPLRLLTPGQQRSLRTGPGLRLSSSSSLQDIRCVGCVCVCEGGEESTHIQLTNGFDMGGSATARRARAARMQPTATATAARNVCIC